MGIGEILWGGSEYPWGGFPPHILAP